MAADQDFGVDMQGGRLKAPDAKRRPIEATHPASSYLGRLRLLVALDCLLVEGSVTRAAERLALSPAAVSRLLGQARELYGDPLLKRSGRRLVPTPRATISPLCGSPAGVWISPAIGAVGLAV